MALYFLAIAISVLVYVTFWYFYGQKLGRLDVADEAWGLAQPFIALVAILITKNYSASSIILFFLNLIWGYRLFSHIHRRHTASPSEDVRYVEMKAKWKKFPRLSSYIYVFLFQGFLMCVLGLASMSLIFSEIKWNYLSVIGLIIWIIGYLFETIADKQLRDFISNPNNKGKIMDQGLWGYSRHPNYFGEVVMWWGIFIFAVVNTGKIRSIVTPLTVTYLIIFVSGIPLTEKLFVGKNGWEEYKRSTSPLVPWPSKKI